MATATRTRKTRKTRTVAAETPEVPDVVDEATGETADEVETEAPEAEAKPKTTAYRTDEGFLDAQKALRSLSKGNGALKPLVMLITHLAWKTPSSSVGWSKGTTPNVIAYANDLAVPVGTPIADAMAVALNAAERSVEGDAQRDSVAVLAKVIRQHG